MMKSLAATDVSVLWAAPSLLKAIKEADGSDLLKRINYVLTGGSPLPTGLGNDLVAAGVPVVTFVAASEGGSILESTQDKGVWDYVRPRPLTERYFTFEAQDDGTYELVIRQGYPSLSMCNRDNGSWATSDLYTPHTTYPNTWKYHGRKDDIILHVTGMKTNPVPSE